MVLLYLNDFNNTILLQNSIIYYNTGLLPSLENILYIFLYLNN